MLELNKARDLQYKLRISTMDQSLVQMNLEEIKEIMLKYGEGRQGKVEIRPSYSNFCRKKSKSLAFSNNANTFHE